MKKYAISLLTVIIANLLIFSNAVGATVSCSFITETTISSSGEWLKSETDFMKLYDMFGDGLIIELDNSLLGNLDSQQPFFAGEVNRGKVYLMGGDYGVEGKLIEAINDQLTIYDGMCTIGFG